MFRAGGVAALAGLAGCLSTPSEAPFDAAAHDAADPDAAAPVCADADGDGWPAGAGGACATSQLDCDDDDPSEHPGAVEPGDGTDRDCDGTGWDGTGPLAPVQAVDVAADLEVTIGALSLRVDAEQGHSIAEMQLGTSGELIFAGPMNERLVAVEAWNSFFSWEDGNDTRATLVRTPALLRFRVTWADGADMNGVTTWTMHAGGRIYRREELTLSTAPTESNVTAYVALTETAATHVDWDGNANPPVELTWGAGVFNTWANQPVGEHWLCAFHQTGGYELGMLSRPSSAIEDSVRITRSQGASSATAQLALQYDWNLGGGPAMPGDYAGSFQIVAAPTDGAPCDAVAGADFAWRNPPGLILRGGALGTAPVGEDLDGDGFAEGGGYWTVVASATPLEIELMSGGGVPPAVTFRIEDLPPGDPIVFLTHDGVERRLVHGPDYRYDVGGGFGWLVIRALQGDTIRIVSPPAPPS